MKMNQRLSIHTLKTTTIGTLLLSVFFVSMLGFMTKKLNAQEMQPFSDPTQASQAEELSTESQGANNTQQLPNSDIALRIQNSEAQDVIQPALNSISEWRKTQLEKLRKKQKDLEASRSPIQEFGDYVMRVVIIIFESTTVFFFMAGLLSFAMILWLYNALT